MRTLVLPKLLGAAGLFLLAISFVLKHYVTAIPDSADGFLKGAAIGLMMIALIKRRMMKQTA